MRTPAVLILAIGVLTSSAEGQTVARAVAPHTSGRCSWADGILRTGNLALADSQTIAYETALICPDGARAIAAAMERRRSSSLAQAAEVFTPAIADTAMLRVALDLASDPTAGLAARTLSYAMLLTYLGTNATASYANLTGTAAGDVCLPGAFSEGALFHVSNLQPDTPARISQRVAPVEGDTAQPAEVRSAAQCVMNAWRASKGLPIQSLIPNPRPALALDYVCGRRFRIRNSPSHEVAVQYEVAGVSGRKPLYLAGKLPGQAHGETQLDLDTSGELRLLFDGDVILTRANAGTTCP